MGGSDYNKNQKTKKTQCFFVSFLLYSFVYIEKMCNGRGKFYKNYKNRINNDNNKAKKGAKVNQIFLLANVNKKEKKRRSKRGEQRIKKLSIFLIQSKTRTN